MKISKFKSHGLALATIVGFAATSSHGATVLFSDDFNRDAALHGSAPSYLGTGYGSLTWKALGQNTTTSGGGLAHVTSGGGGAGQGFNAILAFTPESGKQYLFEIRADVTVGNVSIGMGNHNGAGIGGYDWLSQTMDPSLVGNFGSSFLWGRNPAASAGTDNLTSYDGTGASSGFNTMSWLLDTTQAQWTATFAFNGTTIGTVNTSASDINYVGFGRGGGGSDPQFVVDSVSMTLIPEPSAALLGGLGMLALLRRRRIG